MNQDPHLQTEPDLYLKSINNSNIKEFIILGFSGLPETRYLIFTMLLIIYFLTVSSNIVIITLVMVDLQLRSPMYFFLSNLSFIEIGYISSTVPNLLFGLLTGIKSISLIGCFIQLFVFSCLGATENFLLAVMAYDRYLAICNPLRYTMIMNPKMCIKLVCFSWSGGFIVVLPPMLLIFRLSFCGPNIIDHFLCEAAPLFQLSCSDISITKTNLSLSASAVTFCSVMFTTISYGYIILTILKIPSVIGRKKAFSTCASHLIVVILFYTSLSVMYIKPSGADAYRNKIVTLFYGILTPFMNPFIYTLRNKDVKNALWKCIERGRNLPSYFPSISVIFLKEKKVKNNSWRTQ